MDDSPLTMTDLRRLLLLVGALGKSLAGADPYDALEEVYRDDEWLLLVRDEDGRPDRHWIRAELLAARTTIGSLAENGVSE